jgi:hypothetical protein
MARASLVPMPRTGRWLLPCIVTLTALLPACVSAARRSSSAIGCPTHEIQITDESVDAEGYDTWTATCRGKSWHCSVRPRGRSDQVQCTPVDEGDVGATAELAAAEPQQPGAGADATGAAAAVQAEAPRGAAGFDFGMTRSAAEQRCTAGVGKWGGSGDTMVCSEPPAAVGFSAVARLRFCGDSLCVVRLVHTASEGEANEIHGIFKRVAEALEQKYQRPASSTVTVASDCEAQLASCLREGTATLEAHWKWPSEHAISFQAVASQQGAHLVLEYLAPGTHPAALEGL